MHDRPRLQPIFSYLGRIFYMWGILTHLTHEGMHSQNSFGGGTTM
jgi:hypothetical protein